MALDTILGDRTYPEFYLKLAQNGLKTQHQISKFDLAYDENSFRTTPGRFEVPGVGILGYFGI